MENEIKKEILEKLEALPDKDLFLKLGNKSVKISKAIKAVKEDSQTGLEIVGIFKENKLFQKIA